MKKSDKILIAFTVLLVFVTFVMVVVGRPRDRAEAEVKNRTESEASLEPLSLSEPTEEGATANQPMLNPDPDQGKNLDEEVSFWEKYMAVSALRPPPEGETDLERIKRLIAPLAPGDPDKDYRIRVFIDRQIVAVFSDHDGSGDFAYLEHAFLCSTGLEPKYVTPRGEQEVGVKYYSGFMLDASYCQYCTSFKKTYYFHAPPSYQDREESGVSWKDYNSLGSQASHGCIRLTSRDARWIYENCPEGTVVEVLDTSDGYPQLPLPEQIEALYMKEGEPSWDPTNANPKNPYQQDPSILLPYNRTSKEE